MYKAKYSKVELHFTIFSLYKMTLFIRILFTYIGNIGRVVMAQTLFVNFHACLLR